MNKALTLLLLSIFVITASNVYGASVNFEPQAVKLKVAPGQTGRTAITVHGFSNTAYSLSFLVGSRFKNGNIPKKWLTSAYLWLDAKSEGASTCTMDLVVDVPPDAKPGIYSGVLVPDDMRSSEPITSQGVSVSIEVLD